jgi:hypothetical protein
MAGIPPAGGQDHRGSKTLASGIAQQSRIGGILGPSGLRIARLAAGFDKLGGTGEGVSA